MKRIALFSALAAAGIAAQAQVIAPPINASAPSFVDRARVERVDPQYESVQVPRDECSSQWVTENRPVAGSNGYGGAIIGGVAGGIIGNQVGKGHGREAATAAGAVIGAIAGDRIANQNQPQYEQAQREVRSCRTVHDVQGHGGLLLHCCGVQGRWYSRSSGTTDTRTGSTEPGWSRVTVVYW